MSAARGCVRRDVEPAESNFLSYQTSRELSGPSTSSVCHKWMAAKFGICKDLYSKDLLAHFGCVNAIEFSNRGGEFIVSGGDDRRVLVWNVDESLSRRKQNPVQMKGQHRSNIFCTVFDMDNSHIFSAGNDDQAMRHDLKTRETIGIFLHDDPVYSLNIHPEDNVFITACENGKVLMWDVRTASGSGPSQCIARYSSAAFHGAVFNPVDPVLIATANAKKGVQLWDSRAPKKVLHQYGSMTPQPCAMGVKWNRAGTHLTALRRRLRPALYRIDQTESLMEFNHPGYSNVCTMKSHCFAGDNDQYIVSGSDDFNVYMWRIPEIPYFEGVASVDRAFLVLSGHRSIVNQVRFNPATHMIVSAGVEKIIKVWSPWELYQDKSSLMSPLDAAQRRELYSHDDYVDLVLSSGRPLTHEYDEGSVEEDPRMLAFFDSLIQHEERGWDSDSDDSFSPEEFYLNFARGESSSSDSNTEEQPRGISIQAVRDIIAGYSIATSAREEMERAREREEDEDTIAVLRRYWQLRRARFQRSIAEADVDDIDQAVQERLHPRVMGAQRRRSARRRRREADDTQNIPAPSESTLQYRHDMNRLLLQGEMGSSSDSSSVTSSGPEAQARLASPEPDLEEGPIRFRPRTYRSTRQYRGRGSNSSSSEQGRGSRSDMSSASSSSEGAAARQGQGGSFSSNSDTEGDTRRRHRRRRRREKARGSNSDADSGRVDTTTAVEEPTACETAAGTSRSIEENNIPRNCGEFGVSPEAEELNASNASTSANQRTDEGSEGWILQTSSAICNELVCYNRSSNVEDKPSSSNVDHANQGEIEKSNMSELVATPVKHNSAVHDKAHVDNQSDATSNDCATCNARICEVHNSMNGRVVNSGNVIDCAEISNSTRTDNASMNGHPP